MRRSIPTVAPEATTKDALTPTRIWPWVAGLLVLDIVLLMAAWMAFGGPGLNSQPTPAPTPVPQPSSFSAEHPGVELAPRPTPW